MNIIGMHMADGLISVNIGCIFLVIAIVLIGIALRAISKSQDHSKTAMMAVVGAFVFVAQMINFTIPGTGSSGHIGGGILLCMILGEFPAFLSMACVLIIQCLFFGDGGLLALGCNIFNMGIIPCLIIYPLVIKPFLSKGMSSKRITAASIAGTMISLELGAFCVVLETTASKITTLPFSTFVMFMLPIHLAIGLVEGLVTAGIVNYVYHEDSTLLADPTSSAKSRKVILTLLALIVLTGGGLSLLASGYPDGLEWSIQKITGTTEVETDDPIKDQFAEIQNTTALLPDYNFKDAVSNLGTSTSGIVGAAAVVLVLSTAGFIFSKKNKHE